MATKRLFTTERVMIGVVIATVLAALIALPIIWFSVEARLPEQRPAAAEPTPMDQLRTRVTAGPISAQEQRTAEALLWEAVPLTGARASDVVAFYFNGQATVCGTVGTVRVGLDRRFMVKNGAVLLEGDVSAADFNMFWQICEAGGA